MQKIKDWHNVDQSVFDKEIFPSNRPAVLRGLLRDWPVVQASVQSRANVVDYLKRHDTGGAVNAIVGPPQIDGRFFYSDDFQNFNFESRNVSISNALDTLVSLAEAPQPPAIALQAISVPDVMPSFLTDNPMPLLDDNIGPRIWIGNRSIIGTHFDNNHNIACVVSGSRRFTVFPPDQVGNLYVGPLLRTPGGSPVSTVDLRAPDLERFPRFSQALELAQEAVLETGDAIYIPIHWWHGVESLDRLNILVNYWWNDVETEADSPFLSLIHSMLLISRLPAGQRDFWRTLFEHFVFQADGDPGAHLPPDLRDVLGKLSADEREQVKAHLAEQLKL